MAGLRARKALQARRATARSGEPPAPPAERGAGPADDATFADNLPRTYSGLLDDVMLRYGDDYVGEAFFNKMIAKNVLFGGGMYLNDGYLINHPVARRYLRNDDSLLRVMLATNFIRLLTRKNDPVDLYNMPYEMARNGNRSFEALIQSAEWAELRPVYKDIVQGVFERGNNRSWPGYDMSFGFAKLIGGIFGRRPHQLGLRLVTEDQLKHIADRFHELNPRDGNARDKFEKAVIRVVEGDRTRLAEMMTIANQAYHYNFGLTLTEEDPHGVAVDTTIGLAFDELLATREVARGQLEDFPLIQVPDDLPFDEGDVFLPFLDPSHGVGRLKRAYLGALRRLTLPAKGGISDLRKDARQATDDYFAGMRALFERKVGRSAADTIFSSSIVMGIGNLSSGPAAPASNDVAVTAAPTAGLAISLQSRAMAAKRQFLVERFRLVDADAQFNPGSPGVVTLDDVRPQIASLAFNPQRAQAFIQDIPAIG